MIKSIKTMQPLWSGQQIVDNMRYYRSRPKAPNMYRVVARVPCESLARGMGRAAGLGVGEYNKAVVVMSSSIHRQQRGMATEPGKRPSFIGNLLENLKSEYTKSKEMQDSLAKFREDAKKLEESDALKEARRKFQSIEGESAKTGGAFKEQLSGLTDKLKDTVEDLSKHESLKKASEFTGNLGEKTKGATESLGKAAEQLSQSSAFQVCQNPSHHERNGSSSISIYKSNLPQTATKTASTLKEELEGHSLGGKVGGSKKDLSFNRLVIQ